MRLTIFAVLSLVMLTACDSTQSLQELRLAAPVDDPYQAALVNGYQALAETELSRYQWSESEYFADKGLRAAHSTQIQPEDPATWEIPAAAQPELAAGRTQLLTAIDANKTTQPALTAAAVIDYDRWVTAAHSETNLALLSERRNTFFASLQKLDEVHMVQPGMDAPSSEPVAIAPPAPGTTVPSAAASTVAPTTKAASGTTILYFPTNAASLGKSANATIAALTTSIKAQPKASASINGHTDRVGSDAYNMNLSERRARYVLNALKQAGAPEKMLHYFAFGESDPAVPTADGVAEPRNRRVEIVIEK